MRAVTAIFTGEPGDKNDLFCHQVFEFFGGEHFNEGTYLPTMERDVGYDVADEVAMAVCTILKAAGFRVDNCPTPTKAELDADLERHWIKEEMPDGTTVLHRRKAGG